MNFMCRTCRRSAVALLGLIAWSLSAPAGARAAWIDLLSQTHRAWGHVEYTSYDHYGSTPQSGTATAWADDGAYQGYITVSSSTGGDAGFASVGAWVQSDGPYLVDHGADAQIVYDFRPLDDELLLSFIGEAGHHADESHLYYSLEDVTAGVTLDERSWEYEFVHGWVDDTLPYLALFDVVPAHEYRLTVGAHASAGDMREGFAMLRVNILPEPAAGVLVAVGAVALSFGARRGGQSGVR